MTRQELLNELKVVLDDVVGVKSSDFLVGDSLKLAYLAEGQEKFCEDTAILVDFSNTEFQVTTAAGINNYDISDKIIKVLEVFNGSTRLCSVDDDPAYANEFYYGSVGSPLVWRTDLESDKIRLYPTPTDIITLQMRVLRYPMNSIKVSDPEIPERFQRACVHWAASKILMVQDAEVLNKSAASEQLALYNMYVSDGVRYTRRRSSVNRKTDVNPVYTLGMN